MGAIGRYLSKTWQDGLVTIEQRLLERAERHAAGGRVLDIGCGRGALLRDLSLRAPGAQLVGVDVDSTFSKGEDRNATVEIRGKVSFVRGSVTRGLPFPDGSFDLVISNQVIEHVTETDQFVAETFRVLRPGGRALVATENLASWHNVFALCMGYDPFSISFSKAYKLGNPMSPHEGEGRAEGGADPNAHRSVPTTRSLAAIFGRWGYEGVRVFAGGYPPAPAFVSRALSRALPRHAHFIAVDGRKPPRG